MNSLFERMVDANIQELQSKFDKRIEETKAEIQQFWKELDEDDKRWEEKLDQSEYEREEMEKQIDSALNQQEEELRCIKNDLLAMKEENKKIALQMDRIRKRAEDLRLGVKNCINERAALKESK